MSASLPFKKPLNLTTIDSSKPDEMEWWVLELGASKADITTAIKSVGTSSSAVRRFLKMRGLQQTGATAVYVVMKPKNRLFTGRPAGVFKSS